MSDLYTVDVQQDNDFVENMREIQIEQRNNGKDKWASQ